MTKKTTKPQPKKLIRTNIFLDLATKQYLIRVSRAVSKHKGSRVTSAEVLRAILAGVQPTGSMLESARSAAEITAMVGVMSPDSAEEEAVRPVEQTTKGKLRGGTKWVTPKIDATYAEVIKEVDGAQEFLCLRIVRPTFNKSRILADIARCQRVEGSIVVFYQLVWANDGAAHRFSAFVEHRIIDGPEEKAVAYLLNLGTQSISLLKQLNLLTAVACH